MVGCRRTLCRLIPISIHERIFNNKDSLGEYIVSTMALRIAKGACLRKECPGLTIDNILHNWGACLKVGSSKKKRISFSCPPRVGVLKFNVDGAAR